MFLYGFSDAHCKGVEGLTWHLKSLSVCLIFGVFSILGGGKEYDVTICEFYELNVRGKLVVHGGA